MRVLFVGDVVGKPGRKAVKELLPNLRERHRASFVIVNCENAAGGLGVSPDTARELLASGADCLTSGNHVFKLREIVPYLQSEQRILRPANYPKGAPGSGIGLYAVGSDLIAVINLQGRTFMEPIDCPFSVGDALIAEALQQTPCVVIDFHAETTSEKMAFGWFAAGRASAVVGTHTHVQTADERIIPPGTAYITDVGMTGPLDSVLGVRPDLIIQRFLTALPVRFEVAAGPVLLSAVSVDINPDTGYATSIQRISEVIE